MSRELKTAAYAELAQLGRALAHPHRLELLDLLAQAPRDVDALRRGTERSIASTSQHLQVLAGARLVTRQRVGLRVVYALRPGVEQLLNTVERVGLVHNAALSALRTSRASPIPVAAPIEAAELAAGLQRGDIELIDVRPPEEFAHHHLPGARSFPLDTFPQAMAVLPKDREIVAVCRGPWCTWADNAVEQLVGAGFRARRFEGRTLPTAFGPRSVTE